MKPNVNKNFGKEDKTITYVVKLFKFFITFFWHATNTFEEFKAIEYYGNENLKT